LPLQRLFGECDAGVADNILTFVFLFSKGFLHHLPMLQVSYGMLGKLFFLNSPEVKKHQDTNKNL
jgi:hypothetical protein